MTLARPAAARRPLDGVRHWERAAAEGLGMLLDGVPNSHHYPR